MLLQDALGRFTLQLHADGRSPHTVAQYERHVKMLADWATEAGLDGHVEALDHTAIARFATSDRARLRADGGDKKPVSVNALRTSLRCFFSYLHDAGLVAAKPTFDKRRATRR